MTNLFSTFDPCTGVLSLNWLSTLIMFIIMPQKYWLMSNKNMIIINMIIKTLHNEMKMIMPYKGSTMMMMTMFLMIMYNNVMGLLPYIFTSSSHLVFSLSLALPMWLSFMMYGWLNKTNYMFIHLVPSGTPTILMPFMVLIETISNFIRPGSLAVRLTANMIAGHLLMSLMGNSMISSMTLMLMMMLIFVILMTFEFAVAMIQSYVFMTLTTLYSSEI
uniref:ATP synthase subunit a n=1 Tax=Sahlbergotettix salicicola TaxID=2937677 RepID=A0A9E9FWP6_9HEMI|nr:ATP synthase F0 subunit 6 [Sahlbergotettix salicicola]WAP91675.1 ATP synthase F0 subunit 6 [Sahlbergotettix salicicola]